MSAFASCDLGSEALRWSLAGNQTAQPSSVVCVSGYFGRRLPGPVNKEPVWSGLVAKTFQLIIRSNWANDGQVKLTEIRLFTYFPGRSSLSVTRALTTTRPSRRDQVCLSSTCRSISPGFVRSSPNRGLKDGTWHLPLKADIGCLLNPYKRT